MPRGAAAANVGAVTTSTGVASSRSRGPAPHAAHAAGADAARASTSSSAARTTGASCANVGRSLASFCQHGCITLLNTGSGHAAGQPRRSLCEMTASKYVESDGRCAKGCAPSEKISHSVTPYAHTSDFSLKRRRCKPSGGIQRNGSAAPPP